MGTPHARTRCRSPRRVSRPSVPASRCSFQTNSPEDLLRRSAFSEVTQSPCILLSTGNTFKWYFLWIPNNKSSSEALNLTRWTWPMIRRA
ncbi:uncharacterized protein LOC144317207 isoform X2 [Canis aureus]